MPFSINEAATMFMRRADQLIEQADGVRLGVQVVRMQNARIMQLEAVLKANNIPVPPMPQPQDQPDSAGGPVGRDNVKEFPSGPGKGDPS